MTPYQKAGFNELSLFQTPKYLGSSGTVCYVTCAELPFDVCAIRCANDSAMDAVVKIVDLRELPKDADGFYLCDGGECPVPGDWVVQVKTRQEPCYARKPRIASEWSWRIIGGGSDITAFKPISRPDMPATRKEALDKLVQQAQENGEYDAEASALDVQEGGDHYKKLKIQPMEYSMANKLDPCQHTIIKYVTRFRDKGGIEDLRKAKHCIDMLIEFEQQAKESKQ